jgi:hypothetical protein
MGFPALKRQFEEEVWICEVAGGWWLQVLSAPPRQDKGVVASQQRLTNQVAQGILRYGGI